MPALVYDKAAPKRPVNVNVNSDLVAKAKALGLNLSEALETRLAEVVRLAEEQKWRAENADAIRLYNERIENGGFLLTDLTWGAPDGAV
jgi:antitoxin CcdA